MARPPTHLRLAETLRQHIAAGAWGPGQRLPPEVDLAADLGVARGTLRLALAAIEHSGLIATLPGEGRKRRGRVVVGSGSGSANATAAILADTTLLLTSLSPCSDHDPSHHDGGAGVRAVDAAALQAAQRTGLGVLCVDISDEHRLARLACLRPRGVVVGMLPALAVERLAPICANLRAAGTAVVTAGEATGDHVRFDHAAGAALLVEWLVAHDRRHLLSVGTAPATVPWLADRLSGLHAACAQHGLAEHAHLEIVVAADTYAAANFAIRVRQTAGFLAEPVLRGGIDAILAQNDWDAVLVREALRLLAADERILVSGYDHHLANRAHPFSVLRPAVTVDKRNADLGRELVTLLEDRLAGRLTAPAVERRITPLLIATQ